MGLTTAASALLVAAASVSALSPPLPGVIGLPNSPNSLDTNSTQGTTGATNGPLQKYIVKFHTDSFSKRDVDLHSAFHLTARDSGLSYSTRQTYTNQDHFVGLSLTLENGNIDDLLALENVAKAWPVRSYDRPAAAMIGSMSGPVQNEIQRREAADSTVKLPHITGNIKPNNPHTMTGVDKVHALGYYGAGVKIAAIDTGVDYYHPSLGGCFGEHCKISFGYDFVGDDYPNTTVESTTPLTTCILGGHGTHVMGIIGMEDAENTGFGLLGVAPEAEIGMYRVFGCSGEAESDVILQAMLKAQTDGVDIITMSLGSASPDESSDVFEDVTTSLSDSGIAIFAATGNDAGLYGSEQGMYFMSAPGSGPEVFAVGSVDNSVYPLVYQLRDSNGRHLKYSSVLPLDGPADGLTVLLVGEGSEDELDVQGCYEQDYIWAAGNVTDPSKYILAVLNGGCLSAAKGEAAKAYGFNYMVSYFTDDWGLAYIWGEFDVVSPEYDFEITPIIVNKDDSDTILSSYQRGKGNYKVYFDDQDYSASSPSFDTGGFMSNFSSWGPTLDTGDIKPQLSAPGGNILSTWPLESLQKGYAILSGTSMSTPYMAAAFALLKQARPNDSNKDLFTVMQNSGSLTNWYYDQDIVSPPFQQGSGLLNLHNAIEWESMVLPTSVTLDTSGNGEPVKGRVTIYNRSTRSKTYTFSHKVAGLGQWEFYEGPKNQLYPIHASLEFDQKSILIQAGKSADLTFTVNPPYVSDPAYLPIYSGFIVINNNYETYTIPYIGQPWTLSWPNTEISKWTECLYSYYDSARYPINEQSPSIHGAAQYGQWPTFTSSPLTTYATFSFIGMGYMSVLWSLKSVADYARFDLVPANTTFKPTLYGYDPTVISIPEDELVYPSDLNVTDILGAPVVYTLQEFAGPVNNTDGSLSWYQTELNETLAPDADYRVLLRVLPHGKDATKANNWQSWLSGIVRVDRTVGDVHALPISDIYGGFMPEMRSA